MKKRVTEEMKAAAEARRERFKGFCRRVAEMSDAERAGILARVGAVMSCEGRALSETNTMLLALQSDSVSIVGGFRQWRKAGRYVLKGSKSLSIWIPRGSGDTPALAGSELSRGELVEGGEGSQTAGGRRSRFLLGAVFDISQTAEVGAAADEEGGEGDGEGEGVEAPAVAAVGSPWPPAASVDVLPPESVAAAALPVRTIWDSPDGSGGPLLICAPPRAVRAPAASVAAPAGREWWKGEGWQRFVAAGSRSGPVAALPAPALSALDVPPFPPGPGERAESCLWGFKASMGPDWVKLSGDISSGEQSRRESEGWLVRVGSCGAPTGLFVPVSAALEYPAGVSAPAPGSSSQLSLF